MHQLLPNRHDVNYKRLFDKPFDKIDIKSLAHYYDVNLKEFWKLLDTSLLPTSAGLTIIPLGYIMGNFQFSFPSWHHRTMERSGRKPLAYIWFGDKHVVYSNKHNKCNNQFVENKSNRCSLADGIYSISSSTDLNDENIIEIINCNERSSTKVRGSKSVGSFDFKHHTMNLDGDKPSTYVWFDKNHVVYTQPETSKFSYELKKEVCRAHKNDSESCLHEEKKKKHTHMNTKFDVGGLKDYVKTSIKRDSKKLEKKRKTSENEVVNDFPNNGEDIILREIDYDTGQKIDEESCEKEMPEKKYVRAQMNVKANYKEVIANSTTKNETENHVKGSYEGVYCKTDQDGSNADVESNSPVKCKIHVNSPRRIYKLDCRIKQKRNSSSIMNVTIANRDEDRQVVQVDIENSSPDKEKINSEKTEKTPLHMKNDSSKDIVSVRCNGNVRNINSSRQLTYLNPMASLWNDDNKKQVQNDVVEKIEKNYSDLSDKPIDGCIDKDNGKSKAKYFTKRKFEKTPLSKTKSKAIDKARVIVPETFSDSDSISPSASSTSVYDSSVVFCEENSVDTSSVHSWSSYDIISLANSYSSFDVVSLNDPDFDFVLKETTI